jgi:hypothetical protein
MYDVLIQNGLIYDSSGNTPGQGQNTVQHQYFNNFLTPLLPQGNVN